MRPPWADIFRVFFSSEHRGSCLEYRRLPAEFTDVPVRYDHVTDMEAGYCCATLPPQVRISESTIFLPLTCHLDCMEGVSVYSQVHTVVRFDPPSLHYVFDDSRASLNLPSVYIPVKPGRTVVYWCRNQFKSPRSWYQEECQPFGQYPPRFYKGCLTDSFLYFTAKPELMNQPSPRFVYTQCGSIDAASVPCTLFPSLSPPASRINLVVRRLRSVPSMGLLSRANCDEQELLEKHGGGSLDPVLCDTSFVHVYRYIQVVAMRMEPWSSEDSE